MTMSRIAVVGAGIGGLTAAVALARRGIGCEVYERSAAPGGSGAGLQLSANAMAVLHRLGVGPAPADAVRPQARELRRWQDDSLISRVELGPDAERRFGAPYLTVRRAALSRALLAAAGPANVRFGARCVGVRDDGDGVLLRFADGSQRRAGAVIGADGLHSIVRGAVHQDAVRYSGHTVYRAVLPAERAGRLATPPRVVVWLGPGRHCVTYPVDGGRSLNLVATAPEPAPPTAVREVAGSDLLAAYSGWHPAVRGLLAVAGRFDHHGLFDRPALPSWHRGRVVLLGDAAHPMLPFIAQGAAQAIEDADVLAAHLGEPGGSARYEAARRGHVERVCAVARAGLRDHHLPDGPEQRARDAALAATDLSTFDWLYAAGHDAAARAAR
jgi:salicylate hydroxylase